jgi:uncharacterized protein (TIGR03032 family)
LIDVRANRMLRSDLCMPHSPRIVDDRLYLLNGGKGEVLRIDRKTGAGAVLARLPGFTHGLCAHGGVLFVGLSCVLLPKADVSNRSKAGFSFAEHIEPERAI